jgi:hypothetical protein
MRRKTYINKLYHGGGEGLSLPDAPAQQVTLQVRPGPAGSQGMNGGIQDAHYLAWKLAGALQGGESVLFTESLLPGTTFLVFQIAA